MHRMSKEKNSRFYDDYSNGELIIFMLQRKKGSIRLMNNMVLDSNNDVDKKNFLHVDCILHCQEVKFPEPSNEEIMRHLKRL